MSTTLYNTVINKETGGRLVVMRNMSRGGNEVEGGQLPKHQILIKRNLRGHATTDTIQLIGCEQLVTPGNSFRSFRDSCNVGGRYYVNKEMGSVGLRRA